MKKQHDKYVNVLVGFFMLIGLMALFFMVIKVSGLSSVQSFENYKITAEFTNIGGLKVRAPVTIAGVKIGEVTSIGLKPGQFNATVSMSLRKDLSIPYDDVSARILTEGLLGSNYVSIVPGFDSSDKSHPYLREGDEIAKTQEAMVLENLIGQLLFNIKK